MSAATRPPRRAGIAAALVLTASALSGCEFLVPPSGGSGGSCSTCGDGGNPAGPVDPGAQGPYTVGSLDFAVRVDPNDASDFGKVQLTAFAPGVDDALRAGPYPVVLLTPARNVDRALGVSQYSGYARRLASYGITVVLQRPRDDSDLEKTRTESLQVIDWLRAPQGVYGPKLAPVLDMSRFGLLGHGSGGNLSVVLASGLAGVRGVFAIDPAESTVTLTALQAISKVALPEGVPIGLVGGTASQMGTPPCAPQMLGFEALKAAAPQKALAIAFLGAGLGEFVEDYGSCVACMMCAGTGAPVARTRDLAIKYSAAYFLWTLRDRSEARAYLTGDKFAADQKTGAVAAR